MTTYRMTDIEAPFTCSNCGAHIRLHNRAKDWACPSPELIALDQSIEPPTHGLAVVYRNRPVVELKDELILRERVAAVSEGVK